MQQLHNQPMLGRGPALQSIWLPRQSCPALQHFSLGGPIEGTGRRTALSRGPRFLAEEKGSHGPAGVSEQPWFSASAVYLLSLWKGSWSCFEVWGRLSFPSHSRLISRSCFSNKYPVPSNKTRSILEGVNELRFRAAYVCL